MELAMSAKIHLDPELILKARWAHDMAHVLVSAKRRVMLRDELQLKTA
jgi:hypothetical protein